MSEIQKDWESNSPATNFYVVSGIVLGSVFLGFWTAITANDPVMLAICIVLGLGLAAVYLLFDIANSVKEVAYRT